MVNAYYTVREHRLNLVLNASAAVGLMNMQFIKKQLL